MALTPSATAPNRRKRCRCGCTRKHTPPPQTFWAAFAASPFSATAVNCGICCRCGCTRKHIPPPQAFWAASTTSPPSATAQNHGKRCRCGGSKPPSGSAASRRYALRAIPPTPVGVGPSRSRSHGRLRLREAALPDGSSNYSPASTFAIISSTVEQKHGMAASAADMKPREAIVSKSQRKQS